MEFTSDADKRELLLIRHKDTSAYSSRCSEVVKRYLRSRIIAKSCADIRSPGMRRFSMPAAPQAPTADTKPAYGRRRHSTIISRSKVTHKRSASDATSLQLHPISKNRTNSTDAKFTDGNKLRRITSAPNIHKVQKLQSFRNPVNSGNIRGICQNRGNNLTENTVFSSENTSGFESRSLSLHNIPGVMNEFAATRSVSTTNINFPNAYQVGIQDQPDIISPAISLKTISASTQICAQNAIINPLYASPIPPKTDAAFKVPSTIPALAPINGAPISGPKRSFQSDLQPAFSIDSGLALGTLSLSLGSDRAGFVGNRVVNGAEKKSGCVNFQANDTGHSLSLASVYNKPIRSMSLQEQQLLRSMIPKGLSSAINTIYYVYDITMLLHRCSCLHYDNLKIHPENPRRLSTIFQTIYNAKLFKDMVKLPSRNATRIELSTCHSEPHLLKYYDEVPGPTLQLIPCGGTAIDADTYWSGHLTRNASLIAAGGVTDAAIKVMGDYGQSSCFCLVRPPGHHAERDLALGYGYFNSVAVSAMEIKRRYRNVRICVLDWDIYHANGTQNIFYSDPDVLVINVHKYDCGKSFPGTGGTAELGCGKGAGGNANFALDTSGKDITDADFQYLFENAIDPLMTAFSPHLVYISAGFGASVGSGCGGIVTPECFGWLTATIKSKWPKLVMALEGGFELNGLSSSVKACVQALLGNASFGRPSCKSVAAEFTKDAVERYRLASGSNVVKKLCPRRVINVRKDSVNKNSHDGMEYGDYAFSSSSSESDSSYVEVLL